MRAAVLLLVAAAAPARPQRPRPLPLLPIYRRAELVDLRVSAALRPRIGRGRPSTHLITLAIVSNALVYPLYKVSNAHIYTIQVAARTRRAPFNLFPFFIV